jgi:hypothetical protein
MSTPESAEMEIYSGVNDRPDYVIRFPESVTAEQIAEFEERYLAARTAHRWHRTSWQGDQIAIARGNQANGIPDSRWCGDASCDLNGTEHGHGRSRHPVFKPAPVDLSWVTTEPVYGGPKWLHVVKFVAGIVAMGVLSAIAIAVLVKA